MIVDAHVHVGGPPPEAEPDNFVRLLEKCGIDKAVIFRYFSGKPTAVANEFIRTTVNKYPNRLIGFAWIDPNEETAISEIRSAILNWKFKGIKIHMEMSPAPINKLKQVFAEAAALSIPVCIHLGEDFDSVNKLCSAYDVDVIIAHLGTGVYNLNAGRLEKAVILSQKHPRVYLETSGNTHFFIDYAVKRLGPSKIIFGSDFPHEHPLVSVRTIELLDLPTRDKQLILGDNINRLTIN